MKPSDNPPPVASHMFQIYDTDLEFIERELPRIMDFAMSCEHWNQRKDIREAFDMTKRILSHVRWNYGPPESVTIIPAEGGLEP